MCSGTTTFRQKLSREHRTWIKELIATRNNWAHAGLLDMADEDAWRALDTMTRLIEQIDAEATDRLRALARTVRYGTEGPSTSVAEVEVSKRPGCAAGHPRRRARSRASARIESVAAGGESASRCRGGSLPSGRVRGGSLAGRARWGRRRVPGPGRVLRPHLSHGRHARVDDPGVAADRRPGRGAGHPAQDRVWRRQDPFAAGALPPPARTCPGRQAAGCAGVVEGGGHRSTAASASSRAGRNRHQSHA